MKESIVNTVENNLFSKGKANKERVTFFLQFIAAVIVLIISVITIADAFTGDVKNFNKILPRICGTAISNVASIHYTNDHSVFSVDATDEDLISKIDEELGFSDIPSAYEDFDDGEGPKHYSSDGRYYTYWHYKYVDSDWKTRYYDVDFREYGIAVFDKINWGKDAH